MIGAPAGQATLYGGGLEALRRRPGLGAAGAAPDRLAGAGRLACDLPSTASRRTRPALRRLRSWPSGPGRPPGPGFAQPVAKGRRKALLLADMESTIIAQEMLDELAAAAGLKGPRSPRSPPAPWPGSWTSRQALRERVALLAGLLPESALDEDAWPKASTLNPVRATLVQTLRAGGVYCVLVSGGFDGLHRRRLVAQPAAFDEDRANRLLLEDGQADRRKVARADPRAAGQARRLLGHRRRRAQSGAAASCAVGDGANDYRHAGRGPRRRLSAKTGCVRPRTPCSTTAT